jgi:beta-lactamase regulating signal transducer with metallopeptidase domain
MTAAQFLEVAVSLSVQAALVVVATYGLARVVDRERTRCRLWAVCFQLLLLLVLVALLLPHPRLLQPWASLDRHTSAGLVRLQQQLGRGAFVLWLVGAVVALGHFVVRSVQTAGFLRACAPIDPSTLCLDDLLGDSQKARAGRSEKRRVRLLGSPRLAGPFCWQFHRPYIVLPQFMLGFTAGRLRPLLLHELEHLRSGHFLGLFLQRLVEAIFWFHPLVWWASRRSALAREFACDDAAIDSRSDIAAYLRSLLAVVEHEHGAADRRPISLAFGGRTSVVAERTRRLLTLAERGTFDTERRVSTVAAFASLPAAALLAALIWLPVDVLASPRANWSPWPTWTADVLHDFGIDARDFERYDTRFELHELLEEPSGAADERPSGT